MECERSKNREKTQSVEPRRRGSGQMPRSESSPSFGLMRRWLDDMDRIFEDFGYPISERLRPSLTSVGATCLPHVDMFERNGKLIISADLPGLSKDDVKVDINEDAVLIEGERKYEHEESDEGVYRPERSYGHFRRQIPLPEGVKTDTAAANFKGGVLEITMDAPDLTKSRRRIEIQGEEGHKAA